MQVVARLREAFDVPVTVRELFETPTAQALAAVVAEQFARKASPMSIMPVFMLGGAYAKAAEDETAFGGSRTAKWLFNIAAIAPDPELLATDRAWVREFFDALVPFSSNSGGYVNFIADVDDDRVRTAYGPAKYDRLSRVKTEYDPENVFHLNANIKPRVSA